MLSLRGRMGRRKKTSWFLQSTNFTPWWAAEWSGGIIPCIIQECKLTLSRDIPSIKGGCHDTLPAGGMREGRGMWIEGRMLFAVACCSWWSVRLSIMERESLLELATHYFNRWPQQSCMACEQAEAKALPPGQNSIWALCGNKTTSGQGLKV